MVYAVLLHCEIKSYIFFCWMMLIIRSKLVDLQKDRMQSSSSIAPTYHRNERQTCFPMR